MKVLSVATFVVALALAAPAASSAFSIQAPASVTPGQQATFTATGLEPGATINAVTIQPGLFRGGNGVGVSVDGPWAADESGVATVSFVFPTIYVRCAGGSDCSQYRWDDPEAVVTFGPSADDVETAVVKVQLPASKPATKPRGKLRSCGRVRNPYKGTRYDGVDLSKITSRGASCKTAKRVARRAHYKALGQDIPEDGIRRFSWDGWTVRGDLSGRSDRYTATKGTTRITWRF